MHHNIAAQETPLVPTRNNPHELWDQMDDRKVSQEMKKYAREGKTISEVMQYNLHVK